MPYEVVDFMVYDTTPAKAPVAGVVVKILSPDGRLTYGMSSTGASGQAAFLLSSDVAQYQARFYKFGVSFPQPQLFAVLPAPLQSGQTNTFDVKATRLKPPIPNDARLCTAYGYFRDVTGAPQAGARIHFIAKFNPVWLEGAAVLKERVMVHTDEKGYAQVNLIRNGQYDCTIQGEEDVVRQVNVPDAPNVNLADLIFAVVDRVVTGPADAPDGSFTVRKGKERPLTLNVFSSDGNDMGKAIGEVFYKSSNTDVLSFAHTATGIVLQGISPGTAYVQVTRADETVVRIPYSPVINGSIKVVVTT